jgi:hypothetical protein
MFVITSKKWATLHHLSRKAKLFDFLMQQAPAKALTAIDTANQFDLLLSDSGISACGLDIFSDTRFLDLQPLARKLLTTPASSAAKVRVFSKAGMIMRPNRSRLSKDTLFKLVL